MTDTISSSSKDLLPANALAGVRVGISVSDSPDLPSLGLLEIHFRLALGEIARCVVVSGGTLSYAGRIDPSGYTAFLIKELQRFHRRDRPLLVTLALPEHLGLTNHELKDCRKDLGLFGNLECLDRHGDAVAIADEGRGAGGGPLDPVAAAQALTAMRTHVAKLCHARVFLGGRRTGYTGQMPGLIEEVILSLQCNKPLYLAGGFGGITLDIVKALGVDDASWFPAMQRQAQDAGLTTALEQLSDAARRMNWKATNNGLTAEENRKLASTHRPSEIAALVSLGLGRRFCSGTKP